MFKPQRRLHREDTYKTKPALAVELIQQLLADGFRFDLVLADCLYGESTDFIEAIARLGLTFVVAIRRNHGVWMAEQEQIHYTPWRPFERVFSRGAMDKGLAKSAPAHQTRTSKEGT